MSEIDTIYNDIKKYNEFEAKFLEDLKIPKSPIDSNAAANNKKQIFQYLNI